jgi:hypothetical protein
MRFVKTYSFSVKPLIDTGIVLSNNKRWQQGQSSTSRWSQWGLIILNNSAVATHLKSAGVARSTRSFLPCRTKPSSFLQAYSASAALQMKQHASKQKMYRLM